MAVMKGALKEVTGNSNLNISAFSWEVTTKHLENPPAISATQSACDRVVGNGASGNATAGCPPVQGVSGYAGFRMVVMGGGICVSS